jgi:hypothetical protein
MQIITVMATPLKEIENIIPQLTIKQKNMAEYRQIEEKEGLNLKNQEKFIDSDDWLIYRKRMFSKKPL